MTTYKPPEPSDDLADSGRALWLEVSRTYVIDTESDRLQLLQCCRVADLCDTLHEVVQRDGPLADSSQGVRTHPAVVELRHQRVLLARLLAALGVSSEAVQNARGVYAIRGV